jgi:ATP-dependent RNA helicase RhlE
LSTTQPEITRFTEFPFSEGLQQSLADAGYVTPTPIQARCIVPAIEGKDILGLAQTGTGKTAAFALPIIHRLAESLELGALVLAPTRELVQQIVTVFRLLGRSTGIRVASVVGGVDMLEDWKALRSWPNVLVATPGRLLDHMEQKTVSFASVEIFVIDEADRMHDMGFIPQVRRIIAALPPKRQTLMFTATMPDDVEQVTRRSMHDPVRIQVGLSVPVERAVQEVYRVREEDKVDVLRDILRKEKGRVLIFVRTKRGVDRLAGRVTHSASTSIARLHGDREQAERDEAMGGFREGKYRVLIATDIAARGIDVADIEHVINFDFPRSADDYVHRIGRTARLAAKGRATSFVTGMDRRALAEVESLIGSKIPVAKASAHLAEEEEEASPAPRAASGRRRQGRGGGQGRGSPRGHAAAAHGRGAAQGHKEVAHGHAAAPHGHKEAAHPAASHGHGETEPAAAASAGPEGQPRKRRRRRGGRGRSAGEAGAGQAPHETGGPSSAAGRPHEPPSHAKHPPHPHAHEGPAGDGAAPV